MKTWADFISEFGNTEPERWTKKQWRLVASHFLGERVRKKPGRPRATNNPQSISQHYATAAFWANDHQVDAKLAGKPITFAQALREVKRESAKRSKEFPNKEDPKKKEKREPSMSTLYTESRKIKAKIKRGKIEA